jgi:hypothetical protein
MTIAYEFRPVEDWIKRGIPAADTLLTVVAATFNHFA